MSLGRREANRILFVALGTIVAINTIAAGVIVYEYYQERLLDKKMQEESDALPPTITAMVALARAQEPAQKEMLGKKALAAWERELHDKPQDQCYLGDQAGTVAVDAGDLAKAEDYAHKLLDDSGFCEPDPEERGWFHHDGYIILGRVALRKGDLKRAKTFLIKAGQAPIVEGQAATDSFDPKMILAKELLEKGERESVLQYFDLCSKFWLKGGSVLKIWRASVEAGKMPPFEARSALY